jgi:ribosomal protein S5
MGNSDGIISYASGKGFDYQMAMDNALHNIKKNLIAIPVDPFFTCGSILHGKHNGMKVKITPDRLPGRMKAHPTYVNIMLMAGLVHCRLEVHGR